MRLEAVGKRYGVRQPWVVRDVSLDVPGGRLIRVEGPNGSHGLRGDAGRRRVEEWLERLGASGHAAAPLRALSKGMCQKIAIAQALLARPGLLVLDEAWTGLDVAARGALDDAVAERVGAGGAVLFVDHEPGRLAGRDDERWRLGGDGRVTATAGGTASALALASGSGSGSALSLSLSFPGTGSGDGVVTIELAGVRAGSRARLADRPGVISCSSAALAGRVLLRVEVGQSDSVLREVLAWDGVHVAGVQVAGVQGPRR